MPHESDWYIQDKVVRQTVKGDADAGLLNDLIVDALKYIQNYPKPLYFIYDLTGIENILITVRDILTIEVPQHHCDQIIVIRQANGITARLISLLTNLVGQIYEVEFIYVNTWQEAQQQLLKIDSSLKDDLPPLPES